MKAIELFHFKNDLRERFFPAYQSLTSDQIDWVPEGSKNNIAFILRHIAQSEDWFIRAVIAGEEMIPKRRSELQTVEEMINYLHKTRKRTFEFLEEHSIDILKETRNIPEGYRGEPIEEPTIGWIINRIFDHEVYHLGQVNMILRLQGIDPPNM